jgi:hypothetical protein
MYLAYDIYRSIDLDVGHPHLNGIIEPRQKMLHDYLFNPYTLPSHERKPDEIGFKMDLFHFIEPSETNVGMNRQKIDR